MSQLAFSKVVGLPPGDLSKIFYAGKFDGISNDKAFLR